jgi:hypothetical protein
MSHFCVLVIGEEVEEQLAPYSESDEEYMQFKVYSQEDLDAFTLEYPDVYQNYVKEYEASDKKDSFVDFWAQDWHGVDYNEEKEAFGFFTNEKAKWDWYEVGGRWSGFFNLKDGATGEKCGQYFRGTPQTVTGKADVVQIKNWDIVSEKEEVRQESEKFYDKLESVLKGRPVPSWKEHMEKYPNIEEARISFHSLDTMKDLAAAEIHAWGDPSEKFKASRQEYVNSMVEGVGVPFALVKDGQWYEKGEMGWFGMAHNEKEQEQWNTEFWKLLESLPQDTKLTIVDCHI